MPAAQASRDRWHAPRTRLAPGALERTNRATARGLPEQVRKNSGETGGEKPTEKVTEATASGGERKTPPPGRRRAVSPPLTRRKQTTARPGGNRRRVTRRKQAIVNHAPLHPTNGSTWRKTKEEKGGASVVFWGPCPGLVRRCWETPVRHGRLGNRMAKLRYGVAGSNVYWYS